VFSANKNFYDLCKLIRTTDKIKTFEPNLFFFDKSSKKSWEIGLSLFDLIFNKNKRIPGITISEYLSILKILFVGNSDSVESLTNSLKLKKFFWEPFTLAVMNTSITDAKAKILLNVLKQTIFSGKNKCYIYQPLNNWNETVIQPALEYIKKLNNISFRKRLKSVVIKNDHITRLNFNDSEIDIKEKDVVISALPLNSFSKIFPKNSYPEKFNSILNIHFKITNKERSYFNNQIVGMINSKSHWLFIKTNYLSVTVSNANQFDNVPSESIAEEIWGEICILINKKITMPYYRIIKEKTATFIQSPENFDKIKKIDNLPKNLIISGDWTQNNLPCTIEGSIMSGKKAVEFLR
tara:strand:+ start:2926 stop:3978 length:1053 start_codon:yes stop_codon:yes gene_type:complete